MEMAGEYPDIVIGCVGGGSNFAGIAFPFVPREPARGQGDADHRRRAGGLPDPDQGRVHLRLRRRAGMTPLMQDVHAGPRLHPAAGIHAGGLRYHGDVAAGLARSCTSGYIEAQAVDQVDTFEAGVQFARCEGILPAPESEPRHRARRSTRRSTCKRDRREEGHPLQPLRPRQLRHDGLPPATSTASCRATSTRRRRSPKR